MQTKRPVGNFKFQRNASLAACASQRFRVTAIAALLVFGIASAAIAQDLVHTVIPGDNLYRLAERYLEEPLQWKKLQQFNNVRNPLRLQPGLRLVIPGAMLRAQPTTAEVIHVAGNASAAVPGQPGDQALVAGQRVPEGTRVHVGDGAFVTLRLADGSSVQLPTGTRAQLRQLRHAPVSKEVQSVIQLERGRVDATVTPLPSAKSRFEIHTPLAMGGVRGTRFGVGIGDTGDFLGDVREGAVQVTAEAIQPAPGIDTRVGATATLRANEGVRVGSDARLTVVPLLPAPDLGTPAVIEEISFIELSLPAMPGAASWQVRIATDAAMERVVRNASFSQPVARFAGLPDGDYQLTVRAVDAAGLPGGETQRAIKVKARPEAPLLRQPQQGARIFSPDIELLCTEGLDTRAYQIQVASNAAFTDVKVSTSDLPSCSYRVTGLAPGAYYWRVASVIRDAQGQRDRGPFSKPVAFTVVALPPVPSAPTAQVNDGTTLSVQWGAAGAGPWRYRVQMSQQSDFSTLLEDVKLDAASYTRPLPAPGTYFLRVRQIDSEGNEGAWTGAQRIEVPSQLVSSDNQPVRSTDGAPVRPGAR